MTVAYHCLVERDGVLVRKFERRRRTGRLFECEQLGRRRAGGGRTAGTRRDPADQRRDESAKRHHGCSGALHRSQWTVPERLRPAPLRSVPFLAFSERRTAAKKGRPRAGPLTLAVVLPKRNLPKNITCTFHDLNEYTIRTSSLCRLSI